MNRLVVIFVSLALLGSLILAVPSTYIASNVAHQPGFVRSASSLNSAVAQEKAALPISAFPSYALGAHPRLLESAAGCDDCAYYMQEGTTLEQACFADVTGSCTAAAGFASFYEDVTVQNSPYATGFELNGLTNTGDWFQAVILLNWGGPGLNTAEEVWNNAGASVYSAGFANPVISIGDNIELGLYVSQSGLTAGEACMSASDLTHPSGTFTNCIDQPDPGSTPASNYFELGASNGYFTGPMTEIVDPSASACLNYGSMPEVTYNFVQGAYIIHFSPWSDEWNPSTDAVCYSTVETAPWTMSPGDPASQVVDASSASTYGPHWEAARNTSSLSPSTWWAFTTDFKLPAPVPTPTSMDVGDSSSVSFYEPIEVEHIDSKPTYSGWSTPTSILGGCSVSASGQTLKCAPTGVAGSVTIQFDLGETGGYGLFSPTLAFHMYSDPTVAVPTANRTSADVGQSVDFTATPTGGSGEFTYEWMGLPAGCSGNKASVNCSSVKTAATNTVKVTVTDSNGYSATSPGLPFTVYPRLSEGLAVTPSSLLEGGAVTFVGTASGGAGGLTYLWSGLPTGCAAPSGPLLNCSPSTVGSFNVAVTATDRNGVAASGAVNLTVGAAFLGLPAVEGYVIVGILAMLAIGLILALVLLTRRRKQTPREGELMPSQPQETNLSPQPQMQPAAPQEIGGGGGSPIATASPAPAHAPARAVLAGTGFCQFCGFPAAVGHSFCAKCGKPMPPEPH
jgi:hypothetical protein